jgi:acyl-CoA synthetase (AMP-forming)/AMP-acid ligase II
METPQLPFRPTIPDALHRAVALWGDHDFIVTPNRRMTYVEAEASSRALAKQMLAAGLGKGARVGLFFTYGQEWVIAWLAASRIGALVMPLATTYRPAEIGKVLRMGDIDTLVTARAVVGHDMARMLEDSVSGLAEASGPRLFLPETPSLRAIWITGGTDRAWATSVDLEAEPDTGGEITDELLAALETEVVPPISRRSRTPPARAQNRKGWSTRTAR